MSKTLLSLHLYFQFYLSKKLCFKCCQTFQKIVIRTLVKIFSMQKTGAKLIILKRVQCNVDTRQKLNRKAWTKAVCKQKHRSPLKEYSQSRLSLLISGNRGQSKEQQARELPLGKYFSKNETMPRKLTLMPKIASDQVRRACEHPRAQCCFARVRCMQNTWWAVHDNAPPQCDAIRRLLIQSLPTRWSLPQDKGLSHRHPLNPILPQPCKPNLYLQIL